MRFYMMLCFLLGMINAGHSGLHLGPYLQNVTTGSITVMWETDQLVVGTVKYGISENALTESISEKAARSLHSVKIENLKPGHVYFYRCIWGNESTTTARFQTAPDNAAKPVRFMIYGDSRSDPKRHQKVSRSAAEHDPDLVINTGDLVGDGRIKKLWKRELFDPAADLMKIAPFYSVPGNHEVESDLYYSYFNAGEGKKWWSVDYASVHLIGLNTNVDTSPGSAQYQWLVQDLEANQDKPWIFVFFHNPIFHVHPRRPVYDERYYWQPLFMKYNVDMVFTGHDHYYLRTHPIGRMNALEKSVVHFTVAGGGAPLYTGIDKPFKAFFHRDYHYSIVDIDSGKVFLTAIDINGKPFDEYVLNQQKNFSPTQYVEYDVYDLEHEISSKLGVAYPRSVTESSVRYNIDFSVLPGFSDTMRYNLSWDIPEQWFTADQPGEIILAPGDSLRISLKASASRNKITPTPTLRLHVDFNDSSGSKRFLNQDIIINIEKAASTIAQAADIDNHNVLFSFIESYPESWFGGRVLRRLYRLAFNDAEKRLREKADEALAENSSADNQFRFYPVQFIYGDLDKWDVWLSSIDSLSPMQRELAPGAIYQLTYLKDLNARFVTDWNVLGSCETLKEAELFSTGGTPFFKHTYFCEDSEVNTWKQQETDEWNFLNIGNTFTSEKFEAAYAYTNFKSSRAGKVVLLIGNNSDIQLWLNGKQMFQKQADRHAARCQEVVEIDVKEGLNHLLFQTDFRYDEWGLYLQILDKDYLIK